MRSFILNMGKYSATTMLPTTPPRTISISGSISEDRDSVMVSTSSLYAFAIFSSIEGNSPLSSPMAVISTSILGKIACLASWGAISSPWETPFFTSIRASSRTVEPDVDPTMSRTCISGSPADSRAEKFCANRATVIFWFSFPKIGAFSLMGSIARRIPSRCLFLFHHHMKIAIAITSGIPPILMKSAPLTSIWVGTGRSAPNPANISEKMGTTNRSMATTSMAASASTAMG